MTGQNGWVSPYPSWLELKKVRVTSHTVCGRGVWPHSSSLNSTLDSYGALHWRTSSGHAAPTSCHQSDRRQLSPYIWRPRGRHTSTRPTSLTKFLQRQRNEATRTGKVKRVSLEMLLRKSAKQQWVIRKLKPVWWLLGLTHAASAFYIVSVQLMEVGLF